MNHTFSIDKTSHFKLCNLHRENSKLHVMALVGRKVKVIDYGISSNKTKPAVMDSER